MYYFAAVVVPDRETALDTITTLMARHSRHHDWWCIGGRWTGVWSGYEPREDPANWEPCFICDGTGMRDDELGRKHREREPGYTCNACGIPPGSPTVRPAGMRIKHPPKWARHEGDVLPVADALASGRVPFALITQDGWLENASTDWDQVYREALAKYDGQYVAVVDYHD